MTKEEGESKREKKLMDWLADMPTWSLAIALSSISILAAPFIYVLLKRYKKRLKKEDGGSKPDT